MYKICMSILIGLICIVAGGIYYNVDQISKQTSIPTPTQVPITSELSDRLVLSGNQVNQLVSSYSGDHVSQLEIELKEEEIEVSIEVNEQLVSLLNMQKIEMLDLFYGEMLNCSFTIEQKQISIKSCQVGVLEIPQSLYEAQLSKMNAQLLEWVEMYGIKDVIMLDDAVEIRGDVSFVIQELMK